MQSGPASDSAEVLRFEKRLVPLLSVIAGMVDVIGFLSLGLFTAHITGNIVVIAALLVRGGPPRMDQVLSVPVFVLAVAAVWWAAKAMKRSGPALARPLLMIQFLLLTCVFILNIIHRSAVNPHGWRSVVIAMFAVSAMACQFALLRLSLPVAPSTAVMTGNLTNVTLWFLDTLSHSHPSSEDPNDRLKRTLKLLVGFFGGCVVGAAAVSWLRDWAWLPPVLLAGAACVLR